MRVRCDQCGASYQLDLPPAALARGRRQKFRCTNCGHRFVVVRADGSLTEAIVAGPAPAKQPPAPAVGTEDPTARVSDPESLHGQVTVDLSAALRSEPPSQASPGEGADAGRQPLYLRQAGELYRVDSLSTLQRWVLEQRAGPADALSTGQDDWTPLSEVPALAPLFQAATAAPLPAPPARSRTPGAPSGAAGDLTRAGAQVAGPAPQGTRNPVTASPTEAPGARPTPAAPSPGDGFLPGPSRDSLTDLLLSLEGASAEEAPKSAADPQSSEMDETEEADLAEVLAMLLEGEEGAAEREANAIRHPSLSPDASDDPPDGPPTEQLPDEIASLLSGLQSAKPAPASQPQATEGPAPELRQALDVLPPDISALVSGLAEDEETEEAPRNHDMEGISWTPSEDSGAELPPAPSPFADEPFLELPTEIGDVPYFEEFEDDEDDAPRTDTASRWIFLGAILIFAVGIGAMFFSPGPETPALGSSADTPPSSSAAGAGDPAAGTTDPGATAQPPARNEATAKANAKAEADTKAKAEAKAKADAEAKAKAKADAEAKAEADAKAKASAAKAPPKKTPAASPPRSTDVRALLSRGWSEVDSGEWADAKEIFARAARVSPENGQVHYGLGYIAEKQGNDGEAYREYCVAWAFSTGDIELRREISGRLNVLNRSCD